MSNLPWFIGMILLLWAVWLVTGGPEGGRTDRPFLRAPAPVDTGALYGPTDLVPSGEFIGRQSDKTKKIPEKESGEEDEPVVSIFGGKVSLTFSGRIGAKSKDPKKEYIKVVASKNNSQPVNISGWQVKSAITGKSVEIGEGSYLPYAGRVNSEQQIFLRPGEEATLATTHSPIGVSFKINTCTGYFGQFQNFTPRLSNKCPFPKDEDVPTGTNGVTDECLDYISRMSRCEAQVEALPLSFANDPVCQEFITRELTYNGCVKRHKNEENFYKKKWRIYLKRSEELWKEKRETILLLDGTGKLVDSLSY